MMRTWQTTPISCVKRAWEKIAPLQLADKSWDNVGVMIEAPYPTVENKQVLLTIDLTTAVCKEALALPSCSVIVSYHPPIFRGLKSITLDDPLQSSLLRLAAKGISVFSPHTSLDAAPHGINAFLAQPFTDMAESSTSITSSEQLPGFEGAGMGKIVTLKKGMSVAEIVRMVKAHLSVEHVQVAVPDDERAITSVAVCAGSGGSMFKGVTADLFLTGEMTHHEVLAAVARGQSVVLCNHSNTERPFLSKVLQTLLAKELNAEPGDQGWQVLVSQADRDPLQTM